MNKYKVIKILLCLVLVISVCSLILLINEYIRQMKETDRLITEQYKYEEVQEIFLEDVSVTDSIYHIDKQKLTETNPDYIGWIYVPDTEINYPVVQGTDNNYYLNRSFEKKYSVFGSIFLTAGTENNSDNLVLHGHNMGPGREEMFSSLIKHENNDYAKQHNIIYFSQDEEIDENDKYQVFAVVRYDYTNPDNFDYMISDFINDEEREGYINYLKANSTYVSDFEPSGQLLVLSTCYSVNGNENIRLLVCAAQNNS